MFPFSYFRSLEMKIALAALVVIAAGTTAMADTVTYSGTRPLTLTDWGPIAVTLPAFDNTAGGAFPGATLTNVILTLLGNVDGRVRLENLDPQAFLLTYTLQASLSMTGPGGGSVAALPTSVGNFNASAYDGITDFGGTSGIDLNNILATNGQFSSPLLFNPYIGTGNVSFSLNASGTSSGTGPGNRVAIFESLASAEYSVTYEFTPIPTPGAAALLGLGGLIAVRRRRAR